jgi:glutaminyl-tRNA synthetase
MGVLDPLKVVITNYPEDQVEEFEAINNQDDESQGTRMVPFSREIYVERDDYMDDPPKKFFRLGPGREVRLKHAYFITCNEATKDDAGNVIELHCTYDPESRGGSTPDGRKVRGTIHWVSAPHAVKADVRLYDVLFNKENPTDIEAGQDILDNVNPNSLEVLENCFVEPSLKQAEAGDRFQFLRHGYFCLDPDSSEDQLVFNRTVSLRDTWAKKQ